MSSRHHTLLLYAVALVATLATEWGSFGTPAGRVAYFTIALDCDLPASFPAGHPFDKQQDQ